MIEVQVKSASPGARLSFFVGGKGCDPARTDQEWYVLVGLPKIAWGAARAFVVPRDHMAAATWIRHMEWQTNPTVPPGTRNTQINAARLDDWVFARYEQRWELLEQPASEAPIMLPPRFREWALGDRVGLRDDHPWKSEMPEWDTSECSASWPEWVL
jgi:hypothetical protein